MPDIYDIPRSPEVVPSDGHTAKAVSAIVRLVTLTPATGRPSNGTGYRSEQSGKKRLATKRNRSSELGEDDNEPAALQPRPTNDSAS